MEILLWLVPAAVVTLATMLWVSWVGREGHGEVDRDVAVARLARAMEREHPGRYAPRSRPAPDRSRGVAVRPSRSRAGGAAAERTRRSA